MPPTTRRTPAVPGASPMVPPRPPAMPPPPPQPQQQEEPTPAPAPQQAAPPATLPAHQPTPQQPHVHANMFANTAPAAGTATGQQGGGMSVQLADMIGNGTDPESDRRPEAYRIPRYVIEAVDLAHRLRIFRDDKGKPLPKQEIATEALKAMLPPELLDTAYQALYGRPRPTE